jgi:hypothetical protein
MIFLTDTLSCLQRSRLTLPMVTSYQSGKFHHKFRIIYNYSKMEKDLIKDQ